MEPQTLVLRSAAMFESLGQALLRGAAAVDDGSLAFHRADGNPKSRTICFLPWRMPYRLAVVLGLVPRDYLACYEMPSAIVSFRAAALPRRASWPSRTMPRPSSSDRPPAPLDGHHRPQH